MSDRPSRQSGLRAHNLRLVLARVLDATEPVSRAAVAQSTGLTRATVSSLVDQLVVGGLVVELEPVRARRAGRPAVPLVPASGTVLGLGLEVNVDYLGVRVVDLRGRVVASRIVHGDVRGRAPAEVLAELAGLAGVELTRLGVAATAPDETDPAEADPAEADPAEVMPVRAAPARLAGVCLALPGLVDRSTGPLRLAPNLGWVDVDVLATDGPIAALAPGRVELANEATLAARAEARAVRRGARAEAGAVRRDVRPAGPPELPGPPDPPDPPSFIYVSGEVGIGAAVVIDGEVFGGEHGWSGELGHTVVDPDGQICGCGARGCLETVAGKDAVYRGAGVRADAPVEDLLVRAGADPRAGAALRDAGAALGLALANFVNLVDVHEIVLGGFYRPLAPLLAAPLQQVLDARVVAARWSAVRLRPAHEDPWAALEGAAWTALGAVLADPGHWLAGSRGSAAPADPAYDGPAL